MKKVISVILCLMLVFLCACSSAESESTTAENTTAAPEVLPLEATTAESIGTDEVNEATIMTVYFSHIDPIGAAAEYINEKAGGSIFRVETLKQYPTDEKELLSEIAQELASKDKLAILNRPDQLLDYDIIFLCFPAWGGTLPRAIGTFIEGYDMRDKIIIPIVYGTEEELNKSVIDINKTFPSAMLVKGFSFTGDFTKCQSELDGWLDAVLYG